MKANQRTLWLHRAVLGTFCIAAMVGCGQSTTEAPKAVAPVAAVPAPERGMKEFMVHVISYSAFNVWNWQGWVTDKDGTRALFPKNEDEWVAAESAAQTLEEVVSLLELPNRRVDVPGWDEAIVRVRQLSRESAEAAMNHNEDEFFRLGTELQDACEDCHVAMGLTKKTQ